MIKKCIHILTGWGKRMGILNISNAEAKLAELRMRRCGCCVFAKESKIMHLINGEANYADQLVCTKCNCPCFEKTIVIDESCPIGKW